MGDPITAFIATKLAGLGYFSAAAVVFKFSSVIAVGINVGAAYGIGKLIAPKAEYTDKIMDSNIVTQGGVVPSSVVYGTTAIGADSST